jgi:putative hydrolase of the HAD superfamily
MTNYEQGDSTLFRNNIIVFIDLDGTIMKFPFKREILPIAFKEISDITGIRLDKITQMMTEEERIRERNLNNRRYDWDDIVRTIAGRLGISWDKDLAEISENHTISGDFLYPYAKRVLKALKKNYIVYAATNGLNRYQSPMIRKLGLKMFFDQVITPDRVGYYKNDFRYFKPYLVQYALPIMVGDEYFYDICYPKRFGFKTVLVNRPQNSKWNMEVASPSNGDIIEPDAVIHNLAELPKTIRRILR